MRQSMVTEIESLEELASHVGRHGSLRDAVVQGVDLDQVDVDWSGIDLDGAFFVGCRLGVSEIALELQRGGAVIFPDLDGRPFRIYPPALYTYEQLVSGGTDAAIREYYERSCSRNGGPEPDEPIEAIAQRLHDTAMTDGIWDLVAPDESPRLRVAGVMGGHAARRDDPAYRSVVELSYGLTAAGITVATGGGPGVMEAGNLGAYLTRAGDPSAIEEARELLEQAPTIFDAGYGERAEEVHAPLAGREGGISLAIPTWLYGHEPVGRFATHIAKYFANSIREDGLLRVAGEGIVFAPGGAGTVQEVFQDLAINSYSKPEDRVPMVFLGHDHFTGSGVYGVVADMAAAADPPFPDLISITDDPAEAVAAVVSG